MQFWPEIIFVISNRTSAAHLFDFEITRMISAQIALHSVQFSLLIHSRDARIKERDAHTPIFGASTLSFHPCNTMNLLQKGEICDDSGKPDSQWRRNTSLKCHLNLSSQRKRAWMWLPGCIMTNDKCDFRRRGGNNTFRLFKRYIHQWSMIPFQNLITWIVRKSLWDISHVVYWARSLASKKVAGRLIIVFIKICRSRDAKIQAEMNGNLLEKQISERTNLFSDVS